MDRFAPACSRFVMHEHSSDLDDHPDGSSFARLSDSFDIPPLIVRTSRT
jgi:hypothetical protein